MPTATAVDPATSSSSAAPATWPSASCCRRSTSATATASCPPRPGSSPCRAPASTTPATATRSAASCPASSALRSSTTRPSTGSSAGSPTSASTSTTTTRWPPLVDTLRDGERIRVFYLAIAPGAVRPDLPPARRARPGHRDLAAGAREADRPRPRLGPRDQRRGRRGLRGAADLPHRPLPRQGERAEPAGHCASPTRFLEPLWNAALHRPRADHRRRDRRRRRAAAATTTRPARCATWCRTTCCSCSAWSRWSRRRTSTARPCATRSSRCSRRCKPIDGRATSTATTVRGQYARRRSSTARAVPSLRRGRWARRQPHRDLRRAQGRGRRTGAGPACRSTCAPASGWPARSRRSWSSSSAVPHPMFPRQRGRHRAQPAGHPAAARRGHAAAPDRQGARPRRHPAATGLARPQLRRGLRAPLARRLRAAADGRRARATRPCSCAATRSRPPGRWVEPILDALGSRRADRPQPYPAGTLRARPPPPRCSSATAAPGTRSDHEHAIREPAPPRRRRGHRPHRRAQRARRRAAYLERIRRRRPTRGPARGQLACANLAHGFAACRRRRQGRRCAARVKPQHRDRLGLQRHALGAPAVRALPGADQEGGRARPAASPSSPAACPPCATASPRAAPAWSCRCSAAT